MVEDKFNIIQDNEVFATLETKVRTYRLIDSGRYTWDDIKFNENVGTKYMKCGKLVYVDESCKFQDSLYENAVRCYATVMDEYSVGDIIQLSHREPFKSIEYIILSDEMFLDNYGVGLYLKELDEFEPYRGDMHRESRKSIIGNKFLEVPEPDCLTWFDFVSFYMPKKDKAMQFRKSIMKHFDNSIKNAEEQIERLKSEIKLLEHDRREFDVRFTKYIKKIRENNKFRRQ